MLATALSVKQKIARQFGRAANRYDKHAKVQWQIAQDAMALLPEDSRILLDLGCGTGRAADILKTKCKKIIGCDLALPMLQIATIQHGEQATFLNADAEALPFANGCIDSIYSSMALQWCESPQQMLAELYRVLSPEGSAVIAVPVEGSLRELAVSWQQVAGGSHTNSFASSKQWQQWSEAVGFKVTLSCAPYQEHFSTLKAVLSSIKEVGANQLLTASKTPLTRQLLEEWHAAYKQGFERNGYLPLTYTVAFLQLHKRQINGHP